MSGWGNGYQNQQVANNIDHLASSAKLALEMQEASLKGFEAIEKEILDVTSRPTPPPSEVIRAFAHRLQAQRQQLLTANAAVKARLEEIDRATDTIQKQQNSW